MVFFFIFESEPPQLSFLIFMQDFLSFKSFNIYIKERISNQQKNTNIKTKKVRLFKRFFIFHFDISMYLKDNAGLLHE